MKKVLIIIIIVVLFLTLLPKPYDSVGGIAGNRPGPWKCLGYSFWPEPEEVIPDYMAMGWCIGVPYK